MESGRTVDVGDEAGAAIDMVVVELRVVAGAVEVEVDVSAAAVVVAVVVEGMI